jgi:hypothetical protein
MFTHPTRQAILGLLCAALAAAAFAAIATGRMQSQRIDSRLCKTDGGGRFVDVPGFPGERIDRRLLRDVRMLVRKYKIFVTDGYSEDPVHSKMGEHPLGLALDIVPNRAAGGSWRNISRLARWAEPKQNQPRAPFRWVGYNGDAGHGRGHHLHLSWAHSQTKPFKAARTVYSRRCPSPGSGDTTDPGTNPKPPTDGDSSRKQSGKGGVAPGESKETAGGGGISYRAAKRKIRRQQGAPRSIERGGIALP